ncbi:MAG: GNAT family N-acetyltransferase [Ignavibacteriaceae bacterium]|nr:GNAT family N-acetyltransferase [Ignavibacteriaceae bacterium]
MEKNNLEIIELTTEFASVLSKKLLEESKEYLVYFIPFVDYSEEFIKKILIEKKLDKYFGLFLKRDLIGFYMLRGFDEGYDIPSYGVWISSEYSNKGLSTLTLYHAFSFCRINKIKTMMLKVHPDNTLAKNLYEKLGFVKVGLDEKIGHLVYHKNIL